jgi:hypothetical protein
MTKDASIPLVLFVPAAILAHVTTGGGALEAALTVEDRHALRDVVGLVRGGLGPGGPGVTDTISFDVDPLAVREAAKVPLIEPASAPPTASPFPKPEPARPELAKPEPPPKPPEPEAKPTSTTEPPKPADLTPDRRIAVRQHAPANQPDNPNAPRIADQANHVANETMAANRVKDRDDPDPDQATPASAVEAPKPGDSERDRVTGQSEDKPGDPKRAPGEKPTGPHSHEHEQPGAHTGAPAKPAAAPPAAVVPPGARGSPAVPGAVGAPGSPAGPTPPAEPGGAAAPAAGAGAWSLDPANPGRAGGPSGAASTAQPSSTVVSLGLGLPGAPGGPRLSASMAEVVRAVGEKQLAAERLGDGAARREEHRGKGVQNKWAKYRAAIENYDPSVKVGNQTALNAAQKSFATYLNTIHNRIHSRFAEEFLTALDALPRGHVLNQGLVTHVELVLSSDEGKVLKMGVTKRSGTTMFDAVALSSVEQAAPFGKAPKDIVSPDGKVYLHWEFHRDPVDACSSRNAHPYLLKATTPPLAPPPLPTPSGSAAPPR